MAVSGFPSPNPVIGPRGEEYPSQVAAARSLNVAPSTIWRHLEAFGDLKSIGIGRRGNAGAGRAISIGAFSWPSRAQACRDLRVSKRTLLRWLSDDATDAMKGSLADALMRHSVKMGEGTAKHGTGHSYNLGCRCELCTNANRVRVYDWRRSKGALPKAVRCIWNGVEYESMAAVSRESGWSISTISRHLDARGSLDLMKRKGG